MFPLCTGTGQMLLQINKTNRENKRLIGANWRIDVKILFAAVPLSYLWFLFALVNISWGAWCNLTIKITYLIPCNALVANVVHALCLRQTILLVNMESTWVTVTYSWDAYLCRRFQQYSYSHFPQILFYIYKLLLHTLHHCDISCTCQLLKKTTKTVTWSHYSTRATTVW